MSLRKRQAINSDGGNYRNYSKRGILWTTIDKNTRISGSTPKATGMVTGLSFHTHSNDGSSYTIVKDTQSTVWVSDPSNIALTAAVNPASDDIRNDSAVADPNKSVVSMGAKGLVFSTRCKVAPSATEDKGTPLHFQYNIEKRGSGYKVGDYIIVSESKLGGTGTTLVKVTVTSVA